MQTPEVPEGLISFVIPAYNEEKCIAQTLKTIQKYRPACAIEIIVIDNGSTDQTGQIATDLGAIVLSQPGATIAELRNHGCTHAKGNIFIFLDADVELTSIWQENIEKTLDNLSTNPLQITGSRCLPADQSKWLNKYWFCRLQETPACYVNSGHLITSRELFNSIEGFNRDLTTSEDYDFCMRAISFGAGVTNNPDIPVIHQGYPENIAAFVQRERWHGVEDFKDIRSIVNSKVALIAGFNLIFVLFIIICSFYEPLLILVYPVAMFGVSLLLTIIKFGFTSPAALVNTTIIFIFYIWGRSLAMLDRLFGRPQKSGHKEQHKQSA